MSKIKTKASIIRTSEGLRDAIFDEIDGIRNGTSNPARANSVAKLASTVIDSVRVEIEVYRHLKSVGAGFDASKSKPSSFSGLLLGSSANSE